MNSIVILDTQENKYLDYQSGTDIKIWVTNIDNAHRFTSVDAQVVLDSLNTQASPERFVGRPGDRGNH